MEKKKNRVSATQSRSISALLRDSMTSLNSVAGGAYAPARP
ncbi:hypothetical protein FTUN_0809 [Frigoriglobus tundricola]|uniref:Uncharacterized protein n=1 Tax=Frigoriglobus tundricola TaxID=2774151 RepID=A0A6M5YJ62_9BACT|nr:hypothetical protein FTUN_0809 [Frigoriglobus tundricola]